VFNSWVNQFIVKIFQPHLDDLVFLIKKTEREYGYMKKRNSIRTFRTDLDLDVESGLRTSCKALALYMNTCTGLLTLFALQAPPIISPQ
jgi:hypothetical protein